MAIQTLPPEGTASQQASALNHLSRRDQWAFATNKDSGQQFIRMPSSCKPNQGYYVARDGSACTCEGSRRYPVCSHQLAARIDAQERAAVEIAHQEAMRAWEADGWEPIPEAEQRQAEAFIARCRAETVRPRLRYCGPEDDLTDAF